MMSSKRQGVTLLEIVVVLTLLALVTALAQALIPSASVRPAARESWQRAVGKLRRSAMRSAHKQFGTVEWEGNQVQLVAMPDGRVLSSLPGLVDPFSGSPVR